MIQEDQLQLICSCIFLMLYSIRVHQFIKLLYFRLVFHLPFLPFYKLMNLLNLICQRGICYNIPIYQLIRKINLSLSSSKTDQLAIRTNLVIPRFENVKICPVHTLLNYLKLKDHYFVISTINLLLVFKFRLC